ncbi:hypothetical protein BDA96_09G018300 [Sorghum bicolor]|uniref:Uncharacterized protein n=1 Tax=Sorghum bicolor TaxID=4558 RepID=A0A921U384_SORBI|nr:hypothetical protein BDA96_09G018300 [Sorghum bicolor]
MSPSLAIYTSLWPSALYQLPCLAVSEPVVTGEQCCAGEAWNTIPPSYALP